MMLRIKLYSKNDSIQCRYAETILNKLKKEYELNVEIIDIKQNAELFHRYKDIVPIMSVNGKITRRINEKELREMLDAYSSYAIITR